MQRVNGRIYDTHPDWVPVIVRKQSKWFDEISIKARWLSEHCPDAGDDYDAWQYDNASSVGESTHSIYFFRDPKVAALFALRWS